MFIVLVRVRRRRHDGDYLARPPVLGYREGKGRSRRKHRAVLDAAALGCGRHRHGQQSREDEHQAHGGATAGKQRDRETKGLRETGGKERTEELTVTAGRRRGRRYTKRAGWTQIRPGCRCSLLRRKPTFRYLSAKIRFCPINSMRIHDRIPSVLGDAYPADWLFTNAVFSTLKRCRIAFDARLDMAKSRKTTGRKTKP